MRQQKFAIFKAFLLMVKIKPSGNMCIVKCLFSDQIISIVHIPFKRMGWGGGVAPLAQEHRYVTLKPTWVISEPNGTK